MLGIRTSADNAKATDGQLGESMKTGRGTRKGILFDTLNAREYAFFSTDIRCFGEQGIGKTLSSMTTIPAKCEHP